MCLVQALAVGGDPRVDLPAAPPAKRVNPEAYQAKAAAYMRAAAANPYGSRTGDYMWHLAKVHLKERGW